MSIVEVSGFCKVYGSVTAVDDFYLTADKGEIIALVGPDGAGKTTLFRALAGLIDFNSGNATIARLDVVKQFNLIKPLLGYMPQTFSLYTDLTVEENLHFYSGLFGRSRTEFHHKLQSLYEFSGLGPFHRRRAGVLSGGMKQKLALSCALVHDPEILLLDEPTTGVDPLSRQQFWEILQSLRRNGATIVVSTPYMDEVALADRAVFIHEGKRLAEGTPNQLTANFQGRVFRVAVEPSSQLLARINKLTGLTARRFGTSLHIYSNADYQTTSLKSDLAKIGIANPRVESISPGLEDTFVQLMGN